MLRAGQMRERIELLSRTNERNAHGQIKDDYISLGTLRAQLIKDNVSVSHSEARDNKTRILVLRVRYDSRLIEGMPVRYASVMGYIQSMEALKRLCAYEINIELEY